MILPEPDTRSAARKDLDERIAAEPKLPPIDLPADASFVPMSELRRSLDRRPIAYLGIVENGVVRPLNPAVLLVEQTRVIIVVSQ